MRRQILVILAVGAAACSGCALKLGDAPFLCNSGEPQCPLGYECNNGYCVPEGKCPETVPGCPAAKPACGNNKCEAGEKTSCPKDCTGKSDARPPDQGQGNVDKGPLPPDMMASHDWDPWPPDKGPPPPDTQPALAGYGWKCNNGHPKCQPGLDCVAIGSATTAFCTKECFSSTGAQCTGTPTGTSAYCVIENSSTKKRHCAFLCRLQTQTWPCPGNLTCSSSPNPAGSQQYPCMP